TTHKNLQLVLSSKASSSSRSILHAIHVTTSAKKEILKELEIYKDSS
ncbi:16294_t:CDS:1, partial [Dentiscutata heterogama]